MMTQATQTADRPRCSIIGDEPLAAQCLDLALAAGLEVVAVATVNGAVRHRAEELSIPTTHSDGDLASDLADVDFDVLLSIAKPAHPARRIVGSRIDRHQLPRRAAPGIRRAERHLLGDPQR